MNFFYLLVAALSTEVSNSLPLGSMPLALTAEGSPEATAVAVMGAASVASLFVGIPVGVLVDKVGRLVVMKVSAFANVFVMIAMALVHGPVASGVVMVIRAVVLLGYITAQIAYVSSIVPKDRVVSAGAALGVLGNICIATGPALSIYLWQHGIGRQQYLWASLLNVLATLILFTLPSDRNHVGAADSGPDQTKAKRRRKQIWFRKAWLPAIFFICMANLQNGVNSSLAVLAFQNRGIENGATIFTAAALTTVIGRYPASRLIETIGSRPIALPAVILQALGCLVASTASSQTMVILAGILQGAAWSFMVPIAFSTLLDASSERTRGAVMGSFVFSFTSGSALGALIATISTMFGGEYREAMLCCAGAPFLSLPFLLAQTPKRRKQPKPAPS